MDRSAIARDGRRSQVLEALTFEREREEALRAQITDIVLEEEGDRVDADAFTRMSADDVTRVRRVLSGVEDGDGAEDDDELSGDGEVDDGEWAEAEIRRLEDEIERCRAVQHALERYVAALDGSP